MRYTICDLETCPIADADSYVEPVSAEPVSAPANYKDPDKIADYIARAKVAAEEKAAKQQAERIAKCALDPDLCRIVALGWYRSDINLEQVYSAKNEADEWLLLQDFWKEAKDTILVGFNIVEFDLRVLLRRSLYLGVKAPKFKMGRYAYQRPEIVDLMLDLCWDDPRKAHSLSFYTQRFGLPPVDDDMTGADIGRLVAAGQWDLVEQHCRADVIRTKQLAQRIGAIPASVPAVA